MTIPEVQSYNLSTVEVKQIILTIGSIEHPEAMEFANLPVLQSLQSQFATRIDETDHAWKLTLGVKNSHGFSLTRKQSIMVHDQISSHCQALKNWMASAVEMKDFERARDLVEELRGYERLFAIFNVKAREEIAMAKK